MGGVATAAVVPVSIVAGTSTTIVSRQNWEALPELKLKVAAGQEHMGKVVGAGHYQACTPVTIRAITNDGYKFNSWSNGQDQELFSITMPEEGLELTASFLEGRTLTFQPGGGGKIKVKNNRSGEVVTNDQNFDYIGGVGDTLVIEAVSGTDANSQAFQQ